MILLGGCPTPSVLFDELGEKLAVRHRVLIPDLPGYGGSAEVDSDRDVLTATQFLIEDACRARNLSDVSLVGISLGGYRSLAVALAGKVRVSNVALLGGFAGLDAATRDAFRQFAAAVRARVPLGDVLVARMLSPAFAARNPEVVVAVRSWLELTRPEWLARELDAVADSPDLRPHLRTMNVRMLARVGAADLAAPQGWSEEICRLAPAAHLEVVANAGHLLLFEDSAATIASVATFLAGRS